MSRFEREDGHAIHPQFRIIDGLRIRYADSGGGQEPHVPADKSLAGEHLRVHADVGERSPSTPACSPSTCPGFGALRTPGRSPVASRHGRVPRAAHRRRRSRDAITSSPRTSARRRRSSRRRHIPSGSRAWSSARAARQFPSSSASHCGHGCSIPTSRSTAAIDPREIVNARPGHDRGRHPGRDSRRLSRRATTATASSSRCATSARYPGGAAGCSPSCCRRSRRRSRSSTGGTTASSRVANAEFLHERLPNSRLIVIDAGHFVWEEAPAAVSPAILDSILTGVR